jgi:predicted metal-dependent TIM-barrel fold hydrolase
MRRDLRGVGGDVGVGSDAVPVDQTCALAVLDAGEEQEDVFAFGNLGHGQLCLLMFVWRWNKERD